MEEFNCLDPETTVTGHHFLEASAGTGKTFAIEHVIFRLLVEEGYTLPEILTVTFTKAAARDLRLRITKTLRREYARHPKQELLDAINNLHQLQVYTLHGFCYHVLSQNAFYTGFPLTVLSPDETAQSKQLIEHIRDYFRTSFGKPSFSPFQLTRLFKKIPFTSLEKKLVPLLTAEVDLPDGVFFSQYEESLQHLLEQVNRPQLAQDMCTLAPFYKGICSRNGEIKDEYREQIAFIENGTDIESTLHWKELLIEKYSVENEKKKGAPFVSQEIETAKATWPHLFYEVTSPTSIFTAIAQDMRTYMQEKLEQSELITPDGILSHMKKASHTDSVQNAVRSTYKAVIIDEFQDTDPLQWEIFQNLFYNEVFKVPTCYLVGDPKQSIYSFRNADVYTYLSAKKHFLSQRSLSTNYRSEAPLLASLNALFTHPDVSPLPVEYVHVKPGKKEGDYSYESPPLCFFRGSKEAHLTFVANSIQKYAFGRVAVLVRDRFQAEEMRDVLHRAQIPTVMRHHGMVTDSCVFTLFSRIESVARDPFSSNNLKLLASHPLVGYTEDALLSDMWPDIAATFQEISVEYQQRGLLRTIDSFLHKDIQGKMPIARMVSGYSLDLLSDYYQLLELLHSGYTIQDLARLGEKEDERLVKRPMRRNDAVTIMTMHLSKGLEFDVVYALGVASRFSPKDPLLRYRSSMVRRDSQESKAALHEMQQEKLRQLYVALTRAKKQLYIPLPDQQDATVSDDASPIELFMNGNTDEIVSDLKEYVHFEDASQTAVKVFEHSGDEIPKGPFLHSDGIVAQTAASFSSLARPKGKPSLEIPDTVIPPGSETGTIFHSLFEKVIEDGLYFPYDEIGIKTLIEKKLLHTPLEAWSEEIYHLLKECLQRPYLDGKSLLEIPPEALLPEVEFMYEESGHVYKGVIDLLVNVDGVWHVIDWKTNLLPSYDLAALEQAMIDHEYTLQSEMYSHAVKQYVDGAFGGVYYVFVRGVHNGEGVLYCEA